MNKRFYYWILAIASTIVLSGYNVYSQTTITSNTNWSAITPTPTDATIIKIQDGATLTVDISNAVCLRLVAGGGLNNTISVLFFNSGTQLTVSRMVQIGTNNNRQGSIDMTNAATLKCKGFDVGAAGGFWTPGNGTVELTATDTLPTTIITTFNNLTKNGGTTTLGTNITVDGDATLTLTSGDVNTGAYTLTLGTSTSSRGTLSRTSGTIIGNFKQWFDAATISNVLLPVGTASNYRPANISFTSAPSAGGTLTAFFTASDPGTTGLPLDDGGTSIVNAGIDGYWTITSGDGLTGGTYNLDLTADGFSGVSVVSTLRLLKRSTPGGSWTLDGTHSAGTGTTGTPVVHRTGMTGFSEFGVGCASDNPLPVELTVFSAIIKEGAILLSWETATEVNNYGFEVQRSVTTDKWDVLGFVEGQGNSNSPKEYSFLDSEVSSAGTYSYRLKQIDNDGSYEFSKTIEVNLGSPIKFELSQNYPNPFNPSTTISFNLAESGRVILKIYNLMGEEITTLVEGFREAGIHSFSFNAEGYPSGMYLYRLSTNGFTETKKMLFMK
jgi:hypothetical protein